MINDPDHALMLRADADTRDDNEMNYPNNHDLIPFRWTMLRCFLVVHQASCSDHQSTGAQEQTSNEKASERASMGGQAQSFGLYQQVGEEMESNIKDENE